MILIQKFEVETKVNKNKETYKIQGILLQDDKKEKYCTVSGKMIETLEKFYEGDSVDVEIDFTSHDYNGKWYHNTFLKSIK